MWYEGICLFIDNDFIDGLFSVCVVCCYIYEYETVLVVYIIHHYISGKGREKPKIHMILKMLLLL